MCCHTNRTTVGSYCSKQKKLNSLVWQTGCSDFIDSDDSQGQRQHSTRELLLQPGDVWMEGRQEPQQPKGFKWWIIYLINEKKKKPKKLG
jgi:hypothetical protein